MDGDNLIEARKVEGGWEVWSSPDADAWRGFLQNDRDLQEIRARIVEIEPRLASAVALNPGLRPLRPADPEETAISFLCTPNNHMSRIVRMAAHLASYGVLVRAGHYRFPSAARVAEVDPGELRQAGFGYRSASIPAAAREISSRGEGWLAGLRRESCDAARAHLMEIPGIGPKLADCICLFGLHYDEATPIDTHVWKILSAWDGERASLTRARYELARRAFRDRFGELAGWAQQYIFYERFKDYRNKISARSDRKIGAEMAAMQYH
jgi:N-glycosylase/DNA lyase